MQRNKKKPDDKHDMKQWMCHNRTSPTKNSHANNV